MSLGMESRFICNCDLFAQAWRSGWLSIYWMQPDGQEAYRFHYRVIQLWERPAEIFLRQGWLGLLPLVILTKGGKRPEVVNEMIDRLASVQEYDLLAIARVMGGLVFKEGSDESKWFKGRFHMFQDIPRASWVYKEIGQEFLEQGREEERQRRIQEQQEMLKRLVETRFPGLRALAQQQADSIKDPELLVTMNFKLLKAQAEEEARHILLNLDQNQNKH